MSPRLLEKKLKNDKNFIPHLLAVEKSLKRKGRRTRLETMHKPIDYVRFRGCACITADDSNTKAKSDEIMAESSFSEDLNQILGKHLKPMRRDVRAKVLCELLIGNNNFCGRSLKKLIENEIISGEFMSIFAP